MEATVSSKVNWVLRTLPLFRDFSSPLRRASRAGLSVYFPRSGSNEEDNSRAIAFNNLS